MDIEKLICKICNVNELPLALNVQEVARILKVCEANAYTLCRSEGFPSVVVGRRIVIPTLAFIEWMKSPVTCKGKG